MFDTINQMITDLSKDPFNPDLSYQIALEYEKIGQTASAVSFYLRTAEYGYTTHPEYVYAALLRSSKCFENQQNREITVLNLILKAIAYLPNRPEGWFYLSHYYERDKKWQESYTFAETGLSHTLTTQTPLPSTTEYFGEFCLRFQKAVAAWWVGRKDESKEIFDELLPLDIPQNYKNAVVNNLQMMASEDF